MEVIIYHCIGTNEYFSGNKLNELYAKYWERFEVGSLEMNEMKSGLWEKNSEYNNVRKDIAKERLNKMKQISKYSAMYEVLDEENYSYYGKKTNEEYDWIRDLVSVNRKYGNGYYNNDFSMIGNCNYVFVLRGGAYHKNSGSGIFAYLDMDGGVTQEGFHAGYRPVITF